MKGKITKISLFILIAITSLATMLMPLAYAADSCDANSDGAISTQEAIQCGASGASGGQDPANAAGNVDTLIHRLVNLLSIVVGIVAVVMIVLAGFRYITSGGVSEKVTSAKNTILYAIIGLVIVALAQVIVRYVLTNATNTSAQTGTSTTTTGVSQGAAKSPH